jgi:hypothetical protein
VIRAFWFLVWCVLRLYACTRTKHTIMLDGKPYITRYYLTCARTCNGPEGYYLHHIHAPDADRRLHDHPWHWASSRILRGGYTELRRVVRFAARRTAEVRGTMRRTQFNAGALSVLYAHASYHDYHRIVDIEPNTWTLFRAGPKHGKGWGFEP